MEVGGGGGAEGGVNSFDFWKYTIWLQCLNNFVADCGCGLGFIWPLTKDAIPQHSISLHTSLSDTNMARWWASQPRIQGPLLLF